MSILNVEHLSHGFGDRAIFEDVSFRLLKGEHIGLVGANGEGKSTFMNIITGKLMPDEGKVEWAKNVRVGYLDQHTVLEKGMTIRDVLKSAFSWLYEMEERMNTICDSMGDASEDELNQMMEELGVIQEMMDAHDFYILDSRIEEIGRALGLEEIGLERDVTELSGGQRTKVLLAKLLLEKPDILLLDEPTNYLDVEHITWLKRYLEEYENAFILISHDIPFLNSVVNLIYHMENKELNRYVGDYDHFQEVYAVKKAQKEAAYNRQQQEISELKDFVARNKARVATRNMAMSRQKKLDKMDVIELAKEKPKPEFHFRTARTSGRFVVTAKELVIGYEEPLSRPLTFAIERGEKIVLTGANGIGKTTLLNILASLDKPTHGEVLLDGKDLTKISDKHISAFRRDNLGFVFQDFNLLDTFNVADNIYLPLVLSKEPYALMKPKLDKLAKPLGIDHLLEKYPYEISGGQKQRVAVARALITNPKIILADEPTGALDSKSTDQLLSIFDQIHQSGQTILMVTHSSKAASYASRVLFIKDGQIFHQLYKGDMTNQEMYQAISDTLTMLLSGGQ